MRTLQRSPFSLEDNFFKQARFGQEIELATASRLGVDAAKEAMVLFTNCRGSTASKSHSTSFGMKAAAN